MLPSATLLTQLPPTGILLTTRLGLPMGHPLLLFSPWQDAQVKPDRTKGNQNETAIKHMDHADSWFFVVPADHPGRTCSTKE
jgi:hypothetical protein